MKTYPQAMYGSTNLSKVIDDLFNFTKTPLFICRRRNRKRAFLTLGLT